MSARPADALWRFSLALYARPGVAAALLALQERAGADINLVLCALWLGCRGRRLDPAGLAAAEAAAAPVNAAAVTPLRRLRRELRGADDADLRALRRRLLGLELAAERLVQARLAALAAEGTAAADGRPLELAAANLALALGDEAQSAEAEIVLRALAALTRSRRGATRRSAPTR